MFPARYAEHLLCDAVWNDYGSSSSFACITRLSGSFIGWWCGYADDVPPPAGYDYGLLLCYFKPSDIPYWPLTEDMRDHLTPGNC